MRCKLIAEVGLSHEGSLGLAKAFISASKEAGADAVKFQMHFSKYESSIHEKFRVNFSDQDANRSAYWERTSFTPQEWKILKDYAESLGIEFIVSIFSMVALEIAMQLGMKTFKLGSGDLNNEEFLNEIPKLNINLIVSTGMAYWQEIANAVDAYKSLPNFAILQCTSKYPTPLSEVGLNVMTDIKNRFGVLAGLSDHTGSISSSILAIAAGADLIEKHVIFDKKMFGPDITSSITFEQLDELSRIRDDFILVKQQVDKDKVATELTEIRALFGRSLGLKESRPVGYVIENVNEFCMRKPAGGLPWSSRDQFLGKKLRRNYVAGEFLTIDHLDSANT